MLEVDQRQHLKVAQCNACGSGLAETSSRAYHSALLPALLSLLGCYPGLSLKQGTERGNNRAVKDPLQRQQPKSCDSHSNYGSEELCLCCRTDTLCAEPLQFPCHPNGVGFAGEHDSFSTVTRWVYSEHGQGPEHTEVWGHLPHSVTTENPFHGTPLYFLQHLHSAE